MIATTVALASRQFAPSFPYSLFPCIHVVVNLFLAGVLWNKFVNLKIKNHGLHFYLSNQSGRLLFTLRRMTCILSISNSSNVEFSNSNLWNKAVIVPVPKKKGNLLLPDNYCGISLISTCCKILTKEMANYISFSCKNNNLSSEQAGSRRREECVLRNKLV